MDQTPNRVNHAAAIAELIHLDYSAMAPTVARIIDDIESAIVLPSEDAYGAFGRARGRLELLLGVAQADEARAVARDRKRQEANGESYKDYGFVHSPHRERAEVIRAALVALGAAPLPRDGE